MNNQNKPILKMDFSVPYKAKKVITAPHVIVIKNIITEGKIASFA
mgnify:CR=1 FL=1